jgi:glycosyltransferase involved in cell wall biosynthesis
MAIVNPPTPRLHLGTIARDPGHEAVAPAKDRKWFAPHRNLERNAELDITFFVACYNEEKNILATLENLRDTMESMRFTYEIIVVDDCSKDSTAEVVRRYQDSHPDMEIVLVSNPKNRGLSQNFVEAAFLGRGVYYKLVCGDNVDDKESLHATLNRIGEADLVVPYHQEVQGRSWARLMLSRTYTRLVNLLSGHSLRYYNGCAVYRRADVMRWHSRSSGFGFQAELVTRLLQQGATYVEVAIVGKERAGGTSTALKIKNWFSVGCTLISILFQRLRRA